MKAKGLQKRSHFSNAECRVQSAECRLTIDDLGTDQYEPRDLVFYNLVERRDRVVFFGA
jgi:hypothetical protein